MTKQIEKLGGNSKYAINKDGRREVLINVKHRKITLLFPEEWIIERARPLSKVERSLLKKPSN